jgi:hypothetical protein
MILDGLCTVALEVKSFPDEEPRRMRTVMKVSIRQDTHRRSI